MNYFAKNIKLLRKQKGLTQAQILNFVGFKQSTWNGYETGNSQPYMDGLIKISDYFNVPLSDLIEKDLSISTNKKKPQEESQENAYQEFVNPSLIEEKNTSTNASEKNYSLFQNIIDTLSCAVRGLEASNSALLQRIASLEEENKLLKKEIPQISAGMEGSKAKSA